jgi:Arc/MetJ-type ribon-helix-helix transcriptional regulator
MFMKRRRVGESTPVQVYLGPEERERLEAMAHRLDVTRSDVVRRGLLALERELTDPARHPALQIIGLADAGTADDTLGYSPAVEHDRFLADAEAGGWTRPAARKRGRAR